MPKYFLGKRLLIFTAYPDDEGIAAGTMYENYRAGGETFLICATYGEKGKSHLKKRVPDAALKKIRKEELFKAAQVLHINKIFFLGLPDTHVREHAKELFKKSLLIIQKIKPEYILSFGPDGVSGHWDHIAVGKVALTIAKRLKIPLATAVFSGMTPARRKKFFLARRKFGRYADIQEHHKINSLIKRKVMRNHESQFPGGTPFTTLPKNIVRKMLAYEYFFKEKT